jgi:membrane protease YdiL (CAAX protease family)
MLSEKPWRPEQVLLLLIRLFASLFLGMALVGLLDSTHWLAPTQLKLATLGISLLSFHGAALYLTHRFLQQEGMTWSQAFGFRSPRLGRTMGLTLLVAVAVLPVAWELGEISAKVMNALHIKPVVQDPVQMLQGADTLQMQLYIGLLAVVVAPFAEEVVFRGLIYPTLKQHGFRGLGLWGTSLLFAGVHHNAMVLLPLMFLAIVWTLLYESTDNLLAPVVAHSIFNFANYFLVVIQPLPAMVPQP